MKIKEDIIGLLKFSVAGITATIADVGIFEIIYILTKWSLVGHVCGFTVGLIISYVISAKFVFPNSKTQHKRNITLFAITSLIGLALSSAIIYVLVDLNVMNGIIKNDNISALLSKLIATAIVFFWNYFTKSRIVFKSEDETDTID